MFRALFFPYPRSHEHQWIPKENAFSQKYGAVKSSAVAFLSIMTQINRPAFTLAANPKLPSTLFKSIDALWFIYFDQQLRITGPGRLMRCRKRSCTESWKGKYSAENHKERGNCSPLKPENFTSLRYTFLNITLEWSSQSSFRTQMCSRKNSLARLVQVHAFSRMASLTERCQIRLYCTTVTVWRGRSKWARQTILI